jgi:hypothetical protein
MMQKEQINFQRQKNRTNQICQTHDHQREREERFVQSELHKVNTASGLGAISIWVLRVLSRES